MGEVLDRFTNYDCNRAITDDVITIVNRFCENQRRLPIEGQFATSNWRHQFDGSLASRKVVDYGQDIGRG
jgi:hypothetical protein